MTTAELKKLKESLPPGAMTEIAYKLKISISLVSRVLDNERNNSDVIDLALEMADIHQKKLKRQAKKIKRL